MHELSITRNIVAIVSDAANGRRVRRVTLEVGKLSGVVPDALAFCFDVATQGTALEGAALDINEIEGRARCLDCGAEFPTATLVRRLRLRLAPGGAACRRGAQRQVHGAGGGRLMCATCGCGEGATTTVLNLQTGTETVLSRNGHHHHHHAHGHDHDDGHDHGHDDAHAHSHSHAHAGAGTTVDLETRILAKNDALAEKNRAWFAGREILALNLVSAPGSGKTTLLERTIRDLKDELSLSVLEGDQATANDAERIRAAGAPVVQINTGAGCHLEADMVARGVSRAEA